MGIVIRMGAVTSMGLFCCMESAFSMAARAAPLAQHLGSECIDQPRHEPTGVFSFPIPIQLFPTVFLDKHGCPRGLLHRSSLPASLGALAAVVSLQEGQHTRHEQGALLATVVRTCRHMAGSKS